MAKPTQHGQEVPPSDEMETNPAEATTIATTSLGREKE
jgi:hypothetical protein